MERLDTNPPTTTTTRASRARESRVAAVRALVLPLVVSAGLHGVAVVILAVLVSGDRGEVPTFTGSPIRAALTTPAQPFSVSPPQPTSPPLERERPIPPTAEAPLLPLPLRRLPAPPVKGSPSGQVTIEPLAVTEGVDSAMVAVVGRIYPDAVRARVEFEVAPTGVYPKGALADKRQVHLHALVVVHEDGRVELAQGTQDDPLFTPAIRATLATAKARPLEVNGQARTSWALLSFMFEYVGER